METLNEDMKESFDQSYHDLDMIDDDDDDDIDEDNEVEDDNDWDDDVDGDILQSNIINERMLAEGDEKNDESQEQSAVDEKTLLRDKMLKEALGMSRFVIV